MNKDAILSELEKVRGQMLGLINNNIDSIKTRIENGEPFDDKGNLSEIEMLYPLTISPALFKGTKPTAVFFGDEKVPVKTWRKAYTLILQRCAESPGKRDTLISLCNRITGRTRIILSDKPVGMDFPIEITDGVFIEGDFDAEWLIRILTKGILDAVRYDYSGISVSVIQNKRKGGRYA